MLSIQSKIANIEKTLADLKKELDKDANRKPNTQILRRRTII